MAKTVPPIRITIEQEIINWKPYREALTGEEKQCFDEVTEMYRSNAVAASNSPKNAHFEHLIMSILIGQQKRIKILQRKIDALLVAALLVEKPNNKDR